MYPQDPINKRDLSGEFEYYPEDALSDLSGLLGVLGMFGCTFCAAGSAALSLGLGAYKLATGRADGWNDIASAATFGVGKGLKLVNNIVKRSGLKKIDFSNKKKPRSIRVKNDKVNKRYNNFKRTFVRAYERTEFFYGVVSTANWVGGWVQRASGRRAV